MAQSKEKRTAADFDVIIVGGGPAGLTAALTLGRARRRVLLCDAGKPRNAPAHAAHGVFTRDGTPPAELLRIGREQLKLYTSVQFYSGMVTRAEKWDDAGFRVTLSDGSQRTARKLLLATGVTDELPPVPGMRELWGISVFHCPFCHGWEARNWPLGIYGRGETALELTLLLTGWSRDLILLTDGPSGLTTEQKDCLARNKIQVREEQVERLVSERGELTGIQLVTGEVVPRRGLFVRTEVRQNAPNLAEQLGCTFTPTGAVTADEFGLTEVSGVYVAGDAGGFLQQVGMAAAVGARAAALLVKELIHEDSV
jgi:thioredoxin reductase